MSPSNSTVSPEHASHSSATMMRSLLLDLPDDPLYSILSELPFWEMVNMSQTCGRLRKLALSSSTLWQALPAVAAGQLHTLEPFLARSRALGVDLSVSNICPHHEMDALCAWLDARLARVRALRLQIEDRDTSRDFDDEGARLGRTLAAPAPLLAELCVVGTWDEPFLGDLRPDALGGAPRLRKLELTAFYLNAVCPGLRGVTRVVTSVGALAPHSVAAGANLRVHALFPAIEELHLVGIQVEQYAEYRSSRPLARVPPIDAPLAALRLAWYPASEDDGGKEKVEDVAAVAWLKATAAHVKTVVHDPVHCGAVARAVLAPLLGTARELCVGTCDACSADGARWLELSLEDAQGDRVRTAHMQPEHARALLGKAERLRIDKLVLDTDPLSVDLVKDFQGMWSALPQLRNIRFHIEMSSVDADGAFILPETLASLKPMNNITRVDISVQFDELTAHDASRKLDAGFIVQLLARVFPNARNATVTILPRCLSNGELLSGYMGCEIEYRTS